MKRPILIGIGASQSGSGKTTLAAAILRYYTDHTVDRLSPHSSLLTKSWGAVKYTRISSPPELITDRVLLMKPGKDTWQMLTSGAREVVWVRSARSDLPYLLPKALKRLSHLDLIILEGNSAIEFLKPDIVLFIFGKESKRRKPGIEGLAAGADIILNDYEGALPAEVQNKRIFPRSLSGAGYKDFFGALSGLLYERRAEADNDRKGS